MAEAEVLDKNPAAAPAFGLRDGAHLACVALGFMLLASVSFFWAPWAGDELRPGGFSLCGWGMLLGTALYDYRAQRLSHKMFWLLWAVGAASTAAVWLGDLGLVPPSLRAPWGLYWLWPVGGFCEAWLSRDLSRARGAKADEGARRVSTALGLGFVGGDLAASLAAKSGLYVVGVLFELLGAVFSVLLSEAMHRALVRRGRSREARPAGEPLAGAPSAADSADKTGPVVARLAEEAGLSRRETQVFERAARGMAAAQIARELGISASTARVHASNLRSKLGVGAGGDLAAFAASRAEAERPLAVRLLRRARDVARPWRECAAAVMTGLLLTPFGRVFGGRGDGKAVIAGFVMACLLLGTALRPLRDSSLVSHAWTRRAVPVFLGLILALRAAAVLLVYPFDTLGSAVLSFFVTTAGVCALIEAVKACCCRPSAVPFACLIGLGALAVSAFSPLLWAAAAVVSYATLVLCCTDDAPARRHRPRVVELSPFALFVPGLATGLCLWGLWNPGLDVVGYWALGLVTTALTGASVAVWRRSGAELSVVAGLVGASTAAALILSAVSKSMQLVFAPVALMGVLLVAREFLLSPGGFMMPALGIALGAGVPYRVGPFAIDVFRSLPLPIWGLSPAGALETPQHFANFVTVTAVTGLVGALVYSVGSIGMGHRLATQTGPTVGEWRVRSYLYGRGLNLTQAEVVVSLAEGLTEAQAAQSLHYSRSTVRAARSAGYRVLGVQDRAQLLAHLQSMAGYEGSGEGASAGGEAPGDVR